jgi:superfamily II DNA or RNA helicase/intein/homing endonuclease
MHIILNNTFAHADGTDEELAWLGAFLSYDKKRYLPWKNRYEAKRISLLKMSGYFPAGFGPLVWAEARRTDRALTVDDQRVTPCQPDPSADLEWLRRHPASPQPVTHQLEAVEAVVARKRGLLHIPTGGGKTEVAIGLTRRLPCRWLFLVHRADLLLQTAARYTKRTGLEAGMVGDGQLSVPGDCRFIVATFQTMHSRRDDPGIRALLEQVDGLIVDEVHGLPADTFYDVAMRATNAYYRIGMSVGEESQVLVRDLNKNKEIIHLPIAELARRYGLEGQGSVSPIEGLEVRSFLDGKFQWAPLEKIIAHKPSNTLYEIFLDRGLSLKITGDHSVYKIDGPRLSDIRKPGKGHGHKRITSGKRTKRLPLLQTVTGKELKPGDWLLLEMNERAQDLNPIEEYIDLSKFLSEQEYIIEAERITTRKGKQRWQRRFIRCEDFAYLLGFYLGDGWLDKNKVAFAVERKQLKSFLERLYKVADGKIYIRDMLRGSVEVHLYSKIMGVALTKNIKALADTKRIPNICWSWNITALKALLEGLNNSDGHLLIGKRGRARYYYTTISKQLAADVFELTKLLGYAPSLHWSPPQNGGIVAGKQIIGRMPRWVIHWSPNPKQGHRGGGRWPEHFFNDNSLPGLPIKVRNIREVNPKPDELVYDLCVTGACNFIANGVLVHNSGTPLARADEDNLLTIGALGPVIYRVMPDRLVQAGILAAPHIRMVRVRQQSLKPTWRGVYSESVVKSTVRNRRVVDAVAQAPKPCLVFVQQVKHGKELTDRLVRAGITAEFTWGEKETAARRAAIDRLERGEVETLVCNVIFQEGVDIPTIRSVVIAAGGQSVIAALQRIGRGMRADKATGKRTFDVIDFLDVGCGCVQNHGRDEKPHSGCKWLERHSRARRAAYRSDGYEVEIVDPEQLGLPLTG